MSACVDRWRSRPRNWAIVAAACAAVVCFVCWPPATLWAIGILVGAVALSVGINLFLTERREPTGPSRRHALAFNALSRTLSNAGEHVRLSVRDRATTAVLAAIDSEPSDVSGPDPETTRTRPDITGPQDADQGGDHPDALRNRLRDAVAEAITCCDHGCLTSHHLPAIAQLLGGVGLLQEAGPTPIQATPPLTGRMAATAAPTCGCNLPSAPGIPCGDPATWHIRWAPGAPGDETFPAGLACHAHMEQLARGHAWYDRHPARPACSSADAEWSTGECVPEPEA